MAGYVLSSDAEADLESILDNIASDSVQSGLDVHDRFLDVFRLLAENPKLGHYREDLASRAVRFFPVYSYMIVYLSESSPLEIVRIFGAARDVKTILR